MCSLLIHLVIDFSRFVVRALLKMPRKDITIFVKQQIISDHLQNKLSQRQLQEKYKIGKTTVQRILSKKDELMAIDQHSFNVKKRCRQRGTFKFEDLDAQVFRWFCLARSKRTPISGPILLTKASKIASVLYGPNAFKSSIGWLDRFKNRHKISFKSVCGEGAGVDQVTVADWKQNLSHLTEGYEPKNIFNFDETGLFYKALPKKTLALCDDTCQGGKQSKIRLTVALMASALGEKMTPVVIGNAKRPRAFGRLDVNKSFNIIWKSNKTSWMTAEFFSDFMRNLNTEMMKARRKIIVFIDNAACHPHLELENVKLEFLPPNATSELQPMDQGIIQSFKLQYRKMLLNQSVEYIDKLAANVEAVAPSINQLDAVNWLSCAWNNVKTSTISKCFQMAGFSVECDERSTSEGAARGENNSAVAESEGSLSPLSQIDAEQFLKCDENLGSISLIWFPWHISKLSIEFQLSTKTFLAMIGRMNL